MSAGGLDGRLKFLSLPVEIYNHWLPPVLHQKQVTLLSALEVGIVPHSPMSSSTQTGVSYSEQLALYEPGEFLPNRKLLT